VADELQAEPEDAVGLPAVVALGLIAGFGRHAKPVQVAVGQGAQQEPGGLASQSGAGHLLEVQVLFGVAEHLFGLHAAEVDLAHLGFAVQAGGQVPAAVVAFAE
jgi:hypothetical protein